MSKKILFTASTQSHIENFHLPYLKAFENMGWKVKAVALPVSKSFFSFQNLRAIISTRKLLLSEGFDVISSQSTLAGIVTRLAVITAGKSKLSARIQSPGKQVLIVHTAHGYLFHDNKGLKKWAYILPEKLCGLVTDVLMVMNHEDLAIARKYRLCALTDKIYYINGMGIDLSKFQPIKASAMQRAAFGIGENNFVYVYAAEFSKRKNHELLLRGFAKAIESLAGAANTDISTPAPDNLPAATYHADKLKLVLAGDGVLLEKTKAMALELGIEKQVVFLGYTKNMNELYPCCDVAVSTSRIEGLPFNVMEAMACGLPVVASDIKGHQELVKHEGNGLLFGSGDADGLQFDCEDVDGLAESLIEIYENAPLRERCCVNSVEMVKRFGIDSVLAEVLGVYGGVN